MAGFVNTLRFIQGLPNDRDCFSGNACWERSLLLALGFLAAKNTNALIGVIRHAVRRLSNDGLSRNRRGRCGGSSSCGRSGFASLAGVLAIFHLGYGKLAKLYSEAIGTLIANRSRDVRATGADGRRVIPLRLPAPDTSGIRLALPLQFSRARRARRRSWARRCRGIGIDHHRKTHSVAGLFDQVAFAVLNGLVVIAIIGLGLRPPAQDDLSAERGHLMGISRRLLCIL